MQKLLAIIGEPYDQTSESRIIDLLEGRTLRAANTSLHDRWNKWKKQAGVRQELRLHDLRRGIARRVYATSGDLRVVQSLLGHKQLSSTLHY